MALKLEQLKDTEVTIEYIVKDWLKTHGYDGLCNPDLECGCFLRDDIILCESPTGCVAGHETTDVLDDGKEHQVIYIGKNKKEQNHV